MHFISIYENPNIAKIIYIVAFFFGSHSRDEMSIGLQ